MPISNLAIQRRRINELKRFGYVAEPIDFNNYKEFYFVTSSFTTTDSERLRQAGFMIWEMNVDKNGFFVQVRKDAEEKKQPYIARKIAETMK